MIDVLLESSLRAAMGAAAIGLVLATLRVRDSSVRHRAWTAAVAAMLLMPVLPAWVPAIRVPLPALDSAVAPRQGIEANVDMPAAVARVSSAAAAAPSLGSAPAGSMPATHSIASASPWSWSDVALSLWAVGALTLFGRLARGWRASSRLVASARRIGVAGPSSDTPHIPVSESEHVASPVAVGVLAPQIVLPVAWRTWTAGELRAVLIHERAHIERRDPLTSLLARINTGIFWFHPLAWWLERQLAITAEHACDDHVVLVMPDRRRYAQLLVEMAEAVQQHGGRVAWQSLGIGSGRIHHRVDRVLSSDSPASLSRLRKATVAAACAIVLTLGFACQRPVAELKPDPEFAARLESQRVRTAEWDVAVSMTREQVAGLEALVAQDPDDVDSTRKLLIFYRISGPKVLGWNETVAAQRPLLLRLIERHPENDYARWPMQRSLDPVGYDRARALWLAHIAKPDVTSKTLAAAADFFAVAEKPMAEQLLLRAHALDPDGPQPRLIGDVYYQPWVERLGALYALAIVGSNDEPFNVVRSVSLEQAHGPFASTVRQKLDASTDPRLLSAAGSYLVTNASQAEGKLDFDHQALGQTYLERAVRLDPANVQSQRVLAFLKQKNHNQRLRQLAPDPSDETRINALSDSDRLESLPALAERSFHAAENAEYYHHDKVAFDAALERARRYAEASIELAARHPGDPRSGAAVYRSNITLAVVTLRQNDQRRAVAYMRTAVEKPGSPDMAEYVDSSLEGKLATYMLKAGERESVADFLDRASTFSQFDGDSLRKTAQGIREGRMPLSYQAMLAQR